MWDGQDTNGLYENNGQGLAGRVMSNDPFPTVRARPRCVVFASW